VLKSSSRFVQKNSTTSKILLKNKLNSFRLEKDGSVSDYLNQIQRVLNHLTNIDVIMANSELITQILSTLLDSWEVFASNLMYRTKMLSFTKCFKKSCAMKLKELEKLNMKV
jgi:hypothetical protein